MIKHQLMEKRHEGKVLSVCNRWPDCLCGDDCVDERPIESKAAGYLLAGLMIATTLIGIGLLCVGCVDG